MRLTPRLPALIFSAILFGQVTALIGCGEDGKDDSSLTVSGLPGTLSVGDTTSAFTCTKEARNSLGRIEIQKSYTQFYFVSGDTNVIRVVDSRRLTALKTGTSLVYAKDKASTLSGDKIEITVE